jgi:hypothetical protein
MARIANVERKLSPTRPAVAEAPRGWLESLERSEAQIAAGQTVPLEPVLDRLKATLARMEAKQAGAAKT